MFTPFIICFREGIEIFLIIIPLVVYFNKSKIYEMSRSIYAGSALGAFAATAIGSVLFLQSALLEGPAGDLFDGILGLVLAALILYSIVLIRKNKCFDTDPNKKYISFTKKGVFIIAAITFFREFLEAVLFMLTGASGSPVLTVVFALLGFLCAALCVYLVTKGISSLNISVVFYLLNLFLVGIGAFFFGDALEVLFGNYVPEIFKAGVLLYAVPSYIIIIKKDLKTFMNSNRIK